MYGPSHENHLFSSIVLGASGASTSNRAMNVYERPSPSPEVSAKMQQSWMMTQLRHVVGEQPRFPGGRDKT